MAWHGIDISNHQEGLDLQAVMPNVDFVILKATEGTSFVDWCCDGWAQQLIAAGKPWGFYHFARQNDAVAEADFFVDNTKGYFGKAIPVLDWEVDNDHAWVNRFIERVIERTGVKPWVYANPWRFGTGGVNADCGRWLAAYQSSAPSADIPMCAWQYTSTGRVAGYGGNLDCNWFYGDRTAWDAYAGAAPSVRDIGEAGFQPIPNQAYTGQPVYPEMIPSDTTATYWTSYRDNTEVGWGTAVATGHDAWEGTAEVSFKILPQCLVSYDDIEPTAWYVDAVRQAVERNVMSGYDHETFGPDDALTRAQAVCVVYKAAGMVDDPLPYSDVEQAPWYHAALEWATAQGVACGDEGMFRPTDPCTREEFATMLHRWQGCPEAKAADGCSDWAALAVGWAVESGVMDGSRPGDACTRAEAAAMVTRI